MTRLGRLAETLSFRELFGFRLQTHGGEVGMRDPVVPAEGVFVKKHPSIAHSGGYSREAGGEHAPAAQRATGGGAVEAGHFEAGDAQSWSAGAVDDQQILVDCPE